MKKNVPRFQRRPEQVGSLNLQERDLEIVKLVHDYRFLDTGQIQALIGSSYQATLRRLRKLFHHGFLERPPAQLYLAWFKPRKMVYALGDRGADLLAEKYGIDTGKTKWRRKNIEAKYRYMEHTLMISNVRACLNLALENPPESRLLFWERENRELRDQVYFRERARKRRLPIVPDGFFAIEDKGDDIHFFLEADRGTMTNRRFLNKMRAYWQWWRQGGHENRFGIKAFRVLTVTNTEKRKENLRRTTKKADQKQIGSLMFWFTSEERFDLSEPEGILEPIWQTPKNDRWHSILE